MNFPAANTTYIWRMNETDFALGILDFASDNTISLDRFSSIREVEGDMDTAIATAKKENPEFAVEVVTDAGALSMIDQMHAEIRDMVLEIG
jgi:hypothetical protein